MSETAVMTKVGPEGAFPFFPEYLTYGFKDIPLFPGPTPFLFAYITEVFYGFRIQAFGGSSTNSTSWLARKSVGDRVVWCGAFTLDEYKVVLEGGFLPTVRDFVAAHVCTLAGSWCRSG